MPDIPGIRKKSGPFLSNSDIVLLGHLIPLSSSSFFDQMHFICILSKITYIISFYNLFIFTSVIPLLFGLFCFCTHKQSCISLAIQFTSWYSPCAFKVWAILLTWLSLLMVLGITEWVILLTLFSPLHQMNDSHPLRLFNT